MANIILFPVSTLSDLKSLDEVEQYSGYTAGFVGEDLPRNYSRSYWHGWKTGAVDVGRISADKSMIKLEKEAYEYYRVNKPEVLEKIKRL